MRHVAFVPERDVFEPGLEIPPKHARQPAELFGAPGIALVGHRAGPLLRARRERLLHFAHLGALQVAHFERERLDRRAQRRARVEQLGVTVAGDHLGGRCGTQPELLAHVRLDLRIDVGVRADRAGHLADRDRFPRPNESDPVASELQRPERQLAAEGDGLGVDPVGAPGHGGVAMLMCPRDDGDFEPVDLAQDQIAGAHHGDRQPGVDHVVRREPVVQPLGGGATDPCLDDVDEGGGLVIGDGFAFPDRLEVEVGTLPDRRRVGRRHHPELGPGLRGEHLHLEPGTEAGLVGEEISDFRRGIAVYQGDPSSCRHSTSLERCGPSVDHGLG